MSTIDDAIKAAKELLDTRSDNSLDYWNQKTWISLKDTILPALESAQDKSRVLLKIARQIIADFMEAIGELRDLKGRIGAFARNTGFDVRLLNTGFSPEKHYLRLDQYEERLKSLERIAQ